MKIIYGLIVLSMLMTAACDLEKECSGTVSAVYTIGSSVAGDFNVSNVAATANVLTSDCEALPAGDSANETIDNITRVGNTITLTESSEAIPMSVNGTSVEEFSRTQSISGCTITLVMTGTLNTTDNKIETQGAFAAKGLTCDGAL